MLENINKKILSIAAVSLMQTALNAGSQNPNHGKELALLSQMPDESLRLMDRFLRLKDGVQ